MSTLNDIATNCLLIRIRFAQSKFPWSPHEKLIIFVTLFCIALNPYDDPIYKSSIISATAA